MPRLTPAEAPKSSALKMRNLVIGCRSSHTSDAAQVENRQAIALQNAAKTVAHVTIQARIVIQPPEGRPGEDKKRCPGAVQPFEFMDCRPVIVRRPPVLPILLEKRNRSAVGQHIGAAAFFRPVAVVDEYERRPGRKHALHLLRRLHLL